MKKMKVLSGLLAAVTTLSMVGGMLATAEDSAGGNEICIGNTSMNGQPLSQRTDFDYYAPMTKEEIDKLSDDDAYEILIAYEYRTGDISSRHYDEIPYNWYTSFMTLGEEYAEKFHKDTYEECEKYLKKLGWTPQQAVNALKNSDEWNGLSTRIIYLYKDGQTPTQIEGFDYYGDMIYWETQRLTDDEAYDIINAYSYRYNANIGISEKKITSDDYIEFKNQQENPDKYWKKIREGIDFYLDDLDYTPQIAVEALKNGMFGGTCLSIIDVYCGKRNQNKGDVDGSAPSVVGAESRVDNDSVAYGDVLSPEEIAFQKIKGNIDKISDILKGNIPEYFPMGSYDDWKGDDESFNNSMYETSRSAFSVIRFLGLTPEEVSAKIDEAKAKGEKVAWDVVYVKSDKFKERFGKLDKGDVLIDGRINSHDALEVLKQVVGINDFPTEKIELSDVNGDGVLNTLDALAILKTVVGLE